MVGSASSSTWSPTSTSSSTSDRAAGPPRYAGLIRLVHPFPSALDGLVVVVVALLAGAAVPRAILVGLSMTLLQFSIGATNDIVDAPRDAGLKPGKPIPSGLVGQGTARTVALGAALMGLVAAAVVGPAVLSVAFVVLGIGLAYDLFLKGTALSWLPFAVGIPVLPAFGWLGARGSLDPLFGILLPVAVVAGAALAIANSIVDTERDRAAGVSSVATALGSRAARIGLALQVGVAGVATTSAVASGAAVPWLAAILGADVVLVLGAWLSLDATGSSGSPAVHRRELGWRLQAIAAAALAVGWLAGATRAPGV